MCALRISLSEYSQLHNTSFELDLKHLDILRGGDAMPEANNQRSLKQHDRGDFALVLVGSCATQWQQPEKILRQTSWSTSLCRRGSGPSWVGVA